MLSLFSRGSGSRAYRLSERGRKLLELLEEVEELERERQPNR